MRWAAALVAIGALAAFVVFASLKVQAKGVCCADDAFIAHVAKNFARGEGYVSSLRDDTPLYTRRAFDPMISTGPTLLLPATALMAVFGNEGWVPGATMVLATLALLLAMRLALAKATDPVRLDFAVPVFLALCIAFTALHLEHWYALLGEVPAALLLVLACLLPATRGLDPRTGAWSGVLLGLAFLAKTLAALYFAAFVVVVAAACSPFAPGARGWKSPAFLVAVSVGFALPVLAFEAWKLATLGVHGYVRTWVRFLGVAGPLAVGGAARGAATRIADGSAAFYARFGISLLELNVINWAAVLIARRHAGTFALFLAALAAGVTLQTAWWLLSSNGWPRYMVIGLVVSAFLATVPLFCLRRPRHAAIYLLVLAIWCIGLWPRTVAQVTDLDASSRIGLERTVAFLQGRREALPYLGQWWATVADLEYRLPGSVHFRAHQAVTPEDWQRSFLVVVNETFVLRDDDVFRQLLARCGAPVHEAHPYRVYRCGGES
jgi:hypothetical protein